MNENEYRPLSTISGTAVGVQSTPDGQDILIRHSDTGQSLACLLGFGKADLVRQGDATYWRIAHNKQVDDLLVELIDLLISIRYAHPAMVQLELAQPVPSTSTALSVDSAEGSDSEGMLLEPDEP
jgi:hypothetical protein